MESNESMKAVDLMELMEPMEMEELLERSKSRLIWSGKSIVILSTLFNLMLLSCGYTLIYKMTLDSLPRSLVDSLVLLYKDYGQGDDISTGVWDYVQLRLNCCGVNGPDDWRPHRKFLPSSCCGHNVQMCKMMYEAETHQQKVNKTWHALRWDEYNVSCKAPRTNVGCYEAIRKYVGRFL